MSSIQTTIAAAVNGYCHPRSHHSRLPQGGLMPPKNAALRAFVGAWILHQGGLGLANVGEAALAADVCRPMLHAALELIKAGDVERADRVLRKGESLLRVASELRKAIPKPTIRVVPTLFSTAIASAL